MYHFLLFIHSCQVQQLLFQLPLVMISLPGTSQGSGCSCRSSLNVIRLFSDAKATWHDIPTHSPLSSFCLLFKIWLEVACWDCYLSQRNPQTVPKSLGEKLIDQSCSKNFYTVLATWNIQLLNFTAWILSELAPFCLLVWL